VSPDVRKQGRRTGNQNRQGACLAEGTQRGGQSPTG
jgi:hypothetical protein